MQTVLGLIAAAMLARGCQAPVLPHAVCAAVDPRAAGDRRAVAVDPRADRRRVSPFSVTASSGSPIRLALPVVSAIVVWTNVGYVTLFFLAGILAFQRTSQRGPHRRRDGVAAVPAHHAADAASDAVLVTVTGIIGAARFRHCVRARAAREAARSGGPPHLRRRFGAAAVGGRP